MMFRFCLSFALLGGAGCDPMIEPSDPGEPLFVVHGQLTLAGPLDVGGEVEVALVWAPPLPEVEGEWISSVASVTAVSFPANFSVELHELPPTEALRTQLPPNRDNEREELPWAAGLLVAFEDLDG